eukprot:GDKJ01000132.1.p1 GENE.GDKJ01000132.1~~GDKJ01000132.1.p1  ORF type:complete len:228 (-),score=52.13 GDKJ01000132.1:75-758(-)
MLRSLPRGMNFLRTSTVLANEVPNRAFVKKKKTVASTNNDNLLVRLVPHIPPDQIRETMRFLQSKTYQAAILELIFSPHNFATKLTDESRLEFQKKFEEYNYYKLQFLKDFRAHEAKAQKEMWKAVQELPEDLYDEAAASEWSNPPQDILHSFRYRNQFYKGISGKEPEFSEEELRTLQVFQNLRHVRFPHTAMKQRHPEKFWIRDTMAMSRQKEAALRKGGTKKKK